MDVDAILESLQTKVAILPGCRDVNDRPIIIVDANLPTLILNQHLTVVLRYLLSIFSADRRRKGFCIIVDAQRISWRATRAVLSEISENNIQAESSCLVVLRPEVFWDKRRVEHCTWSDKEDGNPMYIPICRLHKYVNAVHRPLEFGGTWLYDHDAWISGRLNIEKFISVAENTIMEVEETRQQISRRQSVEGALSFSSRNEEQYHYTLTKDKVLKTVNAGYGIIDELEKRHTERQRYLLPIPHDLLDTKERINRLIDIILGKMTLVEEAWLAMKKSINDAKEVQSLEEGVCQVTNWILGPGETMLNSQQDVGYDIYSAEDLRRIHESLELQFREPYGHYAELLHKLDTLVDAGVPLTNDLKFQKDFMDFVCRSFATRVERRRNILITSARFFRLVTEYFQTTSSVYENLVMSLNVEQLESVQCTLSELQECQIGIEKLEKELVKEGEKLSDLLSMPVKNALGRELTVDYQDDIVNVREILDMTVSRRQLFHDSVELQKLTLQQVAHIHSYENDAVQAIEWLNELYKVMLRSHCYIGCDVHEIQLQKGEHQCFQETAKGTFEFGCQLLTAALTLRQSCKLSETVNIELTNNVWQSWNQLHTVSQEQLTRLRVSAVFHRNVNEHCKQLKQLLADMRSIETEMDELKRCLQLKQILHNRENILLEVGRMVRLGKLLKTRLKEPMCVEFEKVYGDNDIAIEAVCAKLSKVSSLARKLDEALCNCQYSHEPSDNPKKTNASGRQIGKTSQVSPISSDHVTKNVVNSKHSHEDSGKSDDDFHSASECTGGTPPSRSSSFHTASEDDPNALWWEVDPSHSDDNENSPGVDDSKSSVLLDTNCSRCEKETAPEVLHETETNNHRGTISTTTVELDETCAVDRNETNFINVTNLQRDKRMPIHDGSNDTNLLIYTTDTVTPLEHQLEHKLEHKLEQQLKQLQSEQRQPNRVLSIGISSQPTASSETKIVCSISDGIRRNKSIVKQAISGIL